MGAAMFYTYSRLVPLYQLHRTDCDPHRAGRWSRFLFAPLTTTAYAHMNQKDSGDATALFTMFRNVSGSIGVSLATALVIERTQVRLAYLTPHATPLDRGYDVTTHLYERGILAAGGHTQANVAQTASALIYQGFGAQASILAYMDIFAFCGVGRIVHGSVGLVAQKPGSKIVVT